MSKSKFQEELNALMTENENLHSQLIKSKDKEMLRVANRDLEEAKRRCNELQSEVNELRTLRAAAADEKTASILASAKELETVNARCRDLNGEKDSLKFKIKCLEDDL